MGTETRHDRLLALILLVVWGLNAYDAMHTHLSGDYEMNPVMRLAYSLSPIVFFASKMLACSLGLLALWKWRGDSGSMVAAVLLLVLYSVGVGVQVAVGLP